VPAAELAAERENQPVKGLLYRVARSNGPEIDRPAMRTSWMKHHYR